MITDFAIWFIDTLFKQAGDLGGWIFVMWFFGDLLATLLGRLVGTWQRNGFFQPIADEVYKVTYSTWFYHPKCGVARSSRAIHVLENLDEIYNSQGKYYVYQYRR